MPSPGNVATPATAGTVVVPERVPLPGFAPSAIVTLPVKPVAVFPCPSSAVTCTAGVMDAPAAVLVGCTVNASWVAVPGAMVNAALVAPVTPVALTVSATGVTGATSAAFTMAPGTATQLAFTVQPTNTAAGASITPAVQVTALDGQGNTATGFTGNVTIALGANPGSGTLSGTTTVPAVAGVATFPGLGINKVGTGSTLTANCGSASRAALPLFTMAPGAATQLAFTVQPTNTAAGAAITPAVQVTALDGQGNTATGFA